MGSGAWGKALCGPSNHVASEKSLEGPEDFELSDVWKRFEAGSKKPVLVVFAEAGLGVFANKSGLTQLLLKSPSVYYKNHL